VVAPVAGRVLISVNRVPASSENVRLAGAITSFAEESFINGSRSVSTSEGEPAVV
jgi:hypothetical protein